MGTPAELIKEKLTIVEVVRQYVKLIPAGKNYKALSPFKKEKTPSFYVSPDRGMYYCFSSGKGGDIFTFVQEMEGVDFRGALRILAERAGIPLDEHAGSREARDERDRLFALMELAARVCQEAFAAHAPAREYLRARGMTDETIARFRIGYAPDAWDSLRMALSKAGYTDAEMERAGLIKKGEKGSYYDRFRSRIMFPLMDPAGRVIAFSGRITGAAAEKPENAKYLNSPETPLFEKSKVLYGFDRAKAAIRKYNFSILVEGQMDLVMSHQAGFANTVAVSGTGLTDEHLTLLSRISPNIVMAFDADSAGVAAGGRGARLALKRGMEVKVAALPSGIDPADLIKEDKEKWREVIKQAVHVIDFFLAHYIAEGGDSRTMMRRVRESVLPFVEILPSPLDKAHFISRIAETLKVPDDAVAAELSRMNQSSSSSTEQHKPVHESPQKNSLRSRKDALLRFVAGVVFASESAPIPGVDESSLMNRLETVIPDGGVKERIEQYRPEQEKLAFEVDLRLGHEKNAAAHIEEIVSDLARELIRGEYTEAVAAQHAAEAEGREEESARLLETCHRLMQQLRELDKSK